MSNQIFPELPGVGWPVNRKLRFSTNRSVATSGQEVRIPNWPYPLEEFEIPINYLHGNAATQGGRFHYQKLYSFYVARLGPADSFLYYDPVDHDTTLNALTEGLTPVTGQNVIGTGDAETTQFQLFRNINGVPQPIFDVDGIVASRDPLVPAVKIYLAGVPLVAGYTVSQEGVVTFAAAPGSTVQIAADFRYFKRCVFSEDNLEISHFMASLYKVQKVKIRQVYA